MMQQRSRLYRVISRAVAIAGLDFHIATTLIFRFWTVFAGGATIVLIPIFLSGVEQGYYYAFASVLALQIFFELGMNQVVLQIVGHEAAHLTHSSQFQLDGDLSKIERISKLAKMLRRWYLIAAALFVVVVGISGGIFFLRQNELPLSHWVGAWAVLTLATAGNLYWSPSLAIIEGCGLVGNVARLRLMQSMAGYISSWIFLLLGFGLWATAFIPVAAFLFSWYWLGRKKGIMRWLLDMPSSESGSSISWRREIFPFQWKIALSWISGYFIFQLFTPVVFRTQGAVEAGRIGIALAIFNAMTSVGMSWVSARVPVMASCIARNERQELNSIFFAVLIRSMSFVAFAIGGFFVCVYAANVLHISYARKIPSLEVLALLAIVALVNSFVFAAAAFMRAHKEEPMLTPSVITGVLIGISVYASSSHGLIIMVALYAAISVFILFPWTLALLRRYLARTQTL